MSGSGERTSSLKTGKVHMKTRDQVTRNGHKIPGTEPLKMQKQKRVKPENQAHGTEEITFNYKTT